MIATEKEKLRKIFDYLSAETVPLKKANGAFVFGRSDSLLAERVYELWKDNLIEYVMITGGIGKDSGFLKELNMPEAVYIASLLRWKYDIPDKKIYVETKATNGGENCRFGIAAILENKLLHEKLILVAHASSLRRFEAVFKKEAGKIGFRTELQKTKTDYEFNPENPKDYKEVVEEILRLDEWPKKDWAEEQHNLPSDLVEYARKLKESGRFS